VSAHAARERVASRRHVLQAVCGEERARAGGRAGEWAARRPPQRARSQRTIALPSAVGAGVARAGSTGCASQLPALPVYLAGCKSLLALHGPTYFQRLWCVLELHIFYQMGGSLDQIQFVRVDGGVHAALAASAVGGGPSASPPPGDETPSRNLFDVRRATATDPFDHARLLAVIEGNGQGIVAFNEWVRGLLHLAHMRDELSAQRRAAAAGGSVGTGSRGRTPLSVRRHPA